ncbi:hypothetical protein AsAng_0041120 [Aureispira anguillae]|uniref:Uncharacterized protein n=1 Tax=Aureispira anguillae TaxID=2864201 RepID=A0A916DVB6_9BACT|nr:hypothetical protein AsAng_0041120 [Aureispira anguillae]
MWGTDKILINLNFEAINICLCIGDYSFGGIKSIWMHYTNLKPFCKKIKIIGQISNTLAK